MMAFATMHVRFTGTAPLLMRSGRLADPLDGHAREIERLARKRSKTPSDIESLMRLEWFGALWVEAGSPCIPGEAIESCFVEAARVRRLGKSAKAAFVCPTNPALKHPGPQSLDQMFEDAAFHLRVPVQVSGRRLMRTRPCFRSWSVETEVHFLPDVLDRRDVLEFLTVGGDRVGLGDWRPRFGRFRVEVLD